MRLDDAVGRGRPRVIALLGQSLLMDSIEAILDLGREEPDRVKIVRLPGSEAWRAHPPKLVPDLIVADFSAVDQFDIFHCLDFFPYVPLLGIDPTSHRVLSLSCEHFNVRTVEDLSTVIGIVTEAKAEPAATGGPIP